MIALVETLVALVTLLAAAWTVIFGGIGALLSHARGGSAAGGLVWGFGLGPLGWGVVLCRTRARHVDDDVLLDDDDDLAFDLLSDDWSRS